MRYNTLDDMDLADRRVLVRVDLNAPVVDGRVTDLTRLERIAPTVRDIFGRGGRPVLIAHFGRPEGKMRADMSLHVVRAALEKALAAPVRFVDECIGTLAERETQAMEPNQALLMENLRFHPGEEANDPGFADALARLGDVYVNDAFSASHRAHASIVALAQRLPACAGRAMQAELEALQNALGAPERPVMAVVGGAKVSSKLALLGNLIRRVDCLVIGGAMANTFLAAAGHGVGASLVERDLLETARTILADARAAGCEIVTPVDLVVARALVAGQLFLVVPADKCPSDHMILDVGPATVALIRERLKAAKTLLWNGPLGAFEVKPFDAATIAAALAAAELTEAGALLSVAGGGDTVSALNAAGAAERFSYVSTAGGAFLEWLEGKTLPGVAALEAAAER